MTTVPVVIDRQNIGAYVRLMSKKANLYTYFFLALDEVNVHIIYNIIFFFYYFFLYLYILFKKNNPKFEISKLNHHSITLRIRIFDKII